MVLKWGANKAFGTKRNQCFITALADRSSAMRPDYRGFLTLHFIIFFTLFFLRLKGTSNAEVFEGHSCGGRNLMVGFGLADKER